MNPTVHMQSAGIQTSTPFIGTCSFCSQTRVLNHILLINDGLRTIADPCCPDCGVGGA